MGRGNDEEGTFKTLAVISKKILDATQKNGPTDKLAGVSRLSKVACVQRKKGESANAARRIDA